MNLFQSVMPAKAGIQVWGERQMRAWIPAFRECRFSHRAPDGCHPEPFDFAQDELREGSRHTCDAAKMQEILRFAQNGIDPFGPAKHAMSHLSTVSFAGMTAGRVSILLDGLLCRPALGQAALVRTIRVTLLVTCAA